MEYPGFRRNSDAEFSEYQKRIEEIDNVILCVAEAEKMIGRIGAHLIDEREVLEKVKTKVCRRGKSSWYRRNSFCK